MKTKFALIALFSFLASNTYTASADVVVPAFEVNCSNATSQVCEPGYSTSITTRGDARLLQMKYEVASTHCSPVRLHVFVDGALARTTEFLGWPGAEAPFNAYPTSTGVLNLEVVPAGVHVVTLKAEGRIGGCNSGALANWGGAFALKP